MRILNVVLVAIGRSGIQEEMVVLEEMFPFDGRVQLFDELAEVLPLSREFFLDDGVPLVVWVIIRKKI